MVPSGVLGGSRSLWSTNRGRVMPEVFHIAARSDEVPRSPPKAGGRARLERSVLDQSERLAQTGSWDWNLSYGLILWTDNMFRLLGIEPGEITPTPEYVLGMMRPEDRERVALQLRSAKEVGTLPDVTYRITRPDGSLRTLRTFSAVAEVCDGRPTRLVGCVQDITELTESQRATREQYCLVRLVLLLGPRIADDQWPRTRGK